MVPHHPSPARSVAAAVAATMSATALAAPCGPWDTVATPNPGLFRNGFLDAAATAGGPVHGLLWSVDQEGSAAPATYRLLRREAGDWSDLGSPPFEGPLGGAAWTCLAVAPDGDVWVGGRAIWEAGTPARPTLVRWDAGTAAWQEPVGVELIPQVEPPFSDRGGAIEAVAVASDGTVFAVGTAAGFGNALDTSVPLFLVGTDARWTEIADPAVNWPGGGVGAGTELVDVLAISPEEVWAVGRHPGGEGLTAGGLMVRWDGGSLEIVEDPRTGGIFLGRLLGGIASTPGGGLIAVGDGTALGGPTVTLAHFDGVDWSLAASPFPAIGALEHVVVAEDGTAWASAVFAPADSAHLEAGDWSLAPFATEPDVRLQRMVRDGDGVLWALGDVGFSDAFAQRLACDPTCPGDVDADGAVGIADLIALLAAWGADDPALDLDGDGAVAIGDLIALLAAWGPCR